MSNLFISTVFIQQGEEDLKAALEGPVGRAQQLAKTLRLPVRIVIGGSQYCQGPNRDRSVLRLHERSILIPVDDIRTTTEVVDGALDFWGY